ncbi:MAG: hypothetical protein PHE93_02650 [Clostridia bacterium]|nr:hypothetical protein [Clostridia bacterium]
MLQVIFTAENEILLPLYKNLFQLNKVEGANYVLLEDGVAIGVCQMTIGTDVEISNFAVQKGKDDLRVQDFFFRTVLFKLSFNPFIVKVKKVDERLLQFGFTEDGDGGMEMLSTQVQFPSSCDCNHKK